MNEKWHSEHPMPKNPTADERVEWHSAHAKACACRPVPDEIKREIARRESRS